MKSLNRVLIILLFLGVIPISCGKDCDFDLSNIKDFRITNMDIKTVNAFGQSIDTSHYHNPDSIFKSIYIDQMIDVAAHQSTSSQFTSFLTGLYACDPPVPKATNNISDIHFISSREQEISYEPYAIGDTINHLFEISQNARYGSNNFHRTFETVEDYLEDDNTLYEYGAVTVKTIAPINTPTRIQFDIYMELDDGKSFLFKNEIIKITR